MSRALPKDGALAARLTTLWKKDGRDALKRAPTLHARLKSCPPEEQFMR
jgi:hypothetical protein